MAKKQDIVILLTDYYNWLFDLMKKGKRIPKHSCIYLGGRKSGYELSQKLWKEYMKKYENKNS